MTLTQWMFSTLACNCDSVDLQNAQSDKLEKQSTPIVEICNSCGLPVLHGRQGSMTQWIFGAGSCKCAASQFQSQTPEVSRETNAIEAFEKFEISSEVSELTTELGLPSDRYQVVQKVGEGASAKVYECQDRILRRLVAIKLLTSGTSSGDAIRKFQSEAKATSKLNHTNIVKVHDFGATSFGQPYMVLEYFTGVSLAALLSIKGPLPEGVAAEIGAQVASAMAAAHQKEIVHRDLKPANIMLVETEDETVVAKVIDFGVADFVVDQSLTAAGHAVVGTPDYMSPDQLRGKKSDPSSDIYSLGCTLFEALTGRLPFLADSSLAVVQMHLNQKPPRLQEAYPSGMFSEPMERLVASMLEKNSTDRISSMEEVRNQLMVICETSSKSDTKSDPQGATLSLYLPDTTFDTKPASAFPLALALSGVALLATIAIVSLNVVKQEAPSVKNSHEEASEASGLDTSIKTLGIPEETRNDSILKQFEHKTDVQKIAFRNSTITDRGLDSITHLPLVTLSLPGTEITDVGFKKICKIKTLLRLNLCQTPKIRAYSEIAQLAKLQSIALTENEMTDKDLDGFKTLTDLRTVNLSTNPINGTGLVNFKNAKLLTDFKMGSAQFTADGIKALGQLKQIHRLSLRNSNIGDPQLDTIVTMPGVVTLDISGTNITNAGLLKLAKMKSLKELRIGECPHVTPHGISKLKKLRNDIDISTPPRFDI